MTRDRGVGAPGVLRFSIYAPGDESLTEWRTHVLSVIAGNSLHRPAELKLPARPIVVWRYHSARGVELATSPGGFPDLRSARLSAARLLDLARDLDLTPVDQPTFDAYSWFGVADGQTVIIARRWFRTARGRDGALAALAGLARADISTDLEVGPVFHRYETVGARPALASTEARPIRGPRSLTEPSDRRRGIGRRA